MGRRFGTWAVVTIVVCGLLVGCSRSGGGVDFRGKPQNLPAEFDPRRNDDGSDRETLFDLFANVDDPNITVEVNKYIWNASLDILNFMPVQAVDPFSGVIVMGFGTPPGGRTSYRATVYIRDPALDARSLNVALQTRSGPANVDTVRAVEDAILTRARQLRLADGEL